MEFVFSELPLAIFTTLAPIGAGAFIVLAIAATVVQLSSDQQKKLDKWILLPILVTIAGFGVAFLHLANPLHALFALVGVGSSPLSNEILAGSVFIVSALFYWVLAVTGKLGSSRKVFLWVLASLAVVFAAFIGMAYYIDTISSWATLAGPISILGLALGGGYVLGIVTLALAGILRECSMPSFRMPAILVAFAGLLLGICGAVAQFTSASQMKTAAANGSVMSADVAGLLAAGIVGLIVAVGIAAAASHRRGAKSLAGVAAIVATVAVFLIRLVFYGLQIGAGL